MRLRIDLSGFSWFANLAAFVVSAFTNFLKADLAYWPLLLHDVGFIWAEVPSVIFFKWTVLGLLDVGASALLIFPYFYLGKTTNLTRKSIAVIMISSFVSVLLGLLAGYGVKQIQMRDYSILSLKTVYVIPSEVGSKAVWCVSGIFLGNYLEKSRKVI